MKKQEKIIQRNEVVKSFCNQIDTMQQIEKLLGKISDIERIVGRIALRRGTVHDYIEMKNSLSILPDLKLILQKNVNLTLINIIQEKIIDFSPLVQLLETGLSSEPLPEYIIKKGFDHQLDRLRELVKSGQMEILQLEQKEIKKTGINSLKIRYNNIAGYYIEVTNPNLKSIPNHYIEQQKLVNKKRFTTKELKNLEHELFRAKNEIEIVQNEVFEKIKREVETYLSYLRQLAQSLAYLDSLFSLAKLAYENNYVCPNFNNVQNISIKNGRHPVVEQKLENKHFPLQ